MSLEIYSKEEYEADERQYRKDARIKAKSDKEAGVVKIGKTDDAFFGKVPKEYKPVEALNIYEISPIDIKGNHEASEVNDPLLEEDYQALKIDIETYGQDVPIILYNGYIVDGRNRTSIAMELGLETVKAVILQGRHSLSELKRIAKSSSRGRQLTATQKAIRGWKVYTNGNGVSQRQSAKQEGTSQGSIGKIIYIAKHKGLNAIEELSAGKNVAVGMKTTNQFGRLYSLLKQKEIEENEASKKSRIGSPVKKDDCMVKAEEYIDMLVQEEALTIKYVADTAYKMYKNLTKVVE